MENKIYWKNAWEEIKQGKTLSKNEIFFNNEKIPWYIVQEFNENNISVPKNLIDYEDEKIDYSDLQSIDILLKNGVFKETIMLKVDTEIADWLRTDNINYNSLLNSYLKTVFQSIRKFNKTTID
jgi:hypothetical protein